MIKTFRLWRIFTREKLTVLRITTRQLLTIFAALFAAEVDTHALSCALRSRGPPFFVAVGAQALFTLIWQLVAPPRLELVRFLVSSFHQR